MDDGATSQFMRSCMVCVGCHGKIRVRRAKLVSTFDNRFSLPSCAETAIAIVSSTKVNSLFIILNANLAIKNN